MLSQRQTNTGEIHAGLNEVVRDTLRPAAVTLAIAYLCFTIAHPLILPERSRTIMTALSAGMLLAALGMWIFFKQQEVSPAQAHGWAMSMIGLVTANILVHMSLTPDPALTINIVVLMIASACLLLSYVWLMITITANLAVWGTGALLNPAADWRGMLHLLVVGLVISLFVHWVRIRTYSKYEALRQEDARLKHELQQTSERLQSRLEFERILTHISTRFLGLSVEEIDWEVEQAMQAVGQWVGVDHVCVCQVAGTPSSFSIIQEWSRPEIVPRKPYLQQVPTASIPYFWQRLEAGQNVQVSRLADLPEEAQADKAFLEQVGTRAVFAVPLASGRQIWGFLVLSMEQQENAWSEDTACLLRVLGEIIVASLKRKEAEQEILNLNRQLEQASRLVGLGEMSANLAHDLGNGLSAVMQYTQGADRRAKRGTLTLENSRQCIQDIREQAERLTGMLMMIQKFVQNRFSQRRLMQLPQVLADAELLTRGKLHQNCVRLHHAEFPEIPPLLADPVQITVVLVNLILNAAQAMSDLEVEKRNIRISLHNDNPDFVEVSIRDQGPGVPPEMIETIFEKFYTTKKDGLGLGLAFSRSYIEQHGGKLWCQSEPGKGCDFRFTLPLPDPSTLEGREKSE